MHRIGRTGRAQAVGDAISFVTSEDHGPLRALERFIGRGIVRKKAEGFDYTAPAPPKAEGQQQARGPRGGGGGNGHGGRSGGARRPQAATASTGGGSGGSSSRRSGGGGGGSWRRR